MKTPPHFTVIHEDDGIVVVNKAAGIAVCPDRWDESKERLDRLVLADLAARAAPADPPPRLFTVHRIDRDTSGAVLFARDESRHRRLSLAFEGRVVSKRYLAVVNGRPPWAETECDLPLVPDGNKRHMTIVDRFRGKKSLTRFAVLGSAGAFSLIEARPETGRTHQIRAHAAALGFPIVCDPIYGSAAARRSGTEAVFLSAIKNNWRGDRFDEKPLLARLGLHAWELSLPAGLLLQGNGTSNGSKNVLTFRAPLPRDMAALVRQMGKKLGTDFLSNGVY